MKNISNLRHLDGSKLSIEEEQNIINQNETLKKEMDSCVSCGCETIYPKRMHIDYRFYYVEGAGQLCKECYEKIYK